MGRRGRGARHAGWVASARRCHRRRRGAEHHQTGEGPGIEDLVWLATEYAYTELVQHGVAAARYEAATTLDAAEVSLDTDGIDRITNSGHPHATEVAEALAAVVGTAVAVQQLKISLSGQCWRRVLIAENATLETLHTYDLGASWQHEILLEKVLADHPLPHLECVTGKGGDPIEYYDPDNPQEPAPFDIAAINERLRKVAV